MFRNFLATPDGDVVHVEGRCIITGKEVRLTVPRAGFDAYYNRGAKIQDAFPELSREVREYLVSGISPEGWSRMFEDDPEDDDPPEDPIL